MSPRAWVPALLAAVVACGGGDARRDADRAAATASRLAWRDAGLSLASRDESQPDLDSARMFFLAGDGNRSAAHLRAAAATNRRHAVEAAEPAASALIQSGAELEALAGQVADDGLRTVAAMDTAFARLQLAEAQHHSARARIAWSIGNPGTTAAEMLMLTDHYERAARDLSESLPPTAQEAIATVRSLAVMLSQTGLQRSADVLFAVSALDDAVGRLKSRVGGARE